jgi:hypothetical protein
VIPSLLLALALLGPPDAAEPAHAQADPDGAATADPVQATTVAGEAAPAAATTPAPTPSLGGWRHALFLGAQANWLVSKEDSRYEFRSFALGYHGSIGARGAFLDASYLVPLQARQDGDTYTTNNYYRRRAGLDLLLGFNWRWAMPRNWEGEAGPALHTTFIYLPGKGGYRDFTATPLGLGAAGAVWWRTGARWLGRAVTVGGSLAAAYDLSDPIHAYDLAHGFMLRFALTVGLGGRT